MLLLTTMVKMSYWKKRWIIQGLIDCVHIKNWAVRHSWPRKKLKNLTPSSVSSSSSSQSLHLLLDRDFQARAMLKDKIFAEHDLVSFY